MSLKKLIDLMLFIGFVEDFDLEIEVSNIKNTECLAYTRLDKYIIYIYINRNVSYYNNLFNLDFNVKDGDYSEFIKYLYNNFKHYIRKKKINKLIYG